MASPAEPSPWYVQILLSALGAGAALFFQTYFRLWQYERDHWTTIAKSVNDCIDEAVKIAVDIQTTCSATEADKIASLPSRVTAITRRCAPLAAKLTASWQLTRGRIGPTLSVQDDKERNKETIVQKRLIYLNAHIGKLRDILNDDTPITGKNMANDYAKKILYESQMINTDLMLAITEVVGRPWAWLAKLKLKINKLRSRHPKENDFFS